MSSLQNRISFGDAVLSRLETATLEGVKEERETFRERHEALLAVRRTVEGVIEEDTADPPSTLLHAWDAALRRLTDRVRGVDPGAVAHIFAASGKATTASAPTPKRTATKGRARRLAPRPKRAEGPRVTAVEAKHAPKSKPKTPAAKKLVAKAKSPKKQPNKRR